MSVATLTSKGQITIPVAVRERLGIEAGDKVDFVSDDSGGFKVVALRKDVRALKGRFQGRAAKSVTIEQMKEGVGSEATMRHRSIITTRKGAATARKAKR